VDSILPGILFYILLLILSSYLLNRRKVDKSIPLVYTLRQKIIRIVSAGFVVFTIVLLSKLLSPYWGGLIAIYPIAFSIMLVIVHNQYGTNDLFAVSQKIPLGSLSLFAYMLTAFLTFHVYGFIIGTLISYLISIIVTLLIIYIQNKLNKTT